RGFLERLAIGGRRRIEAAQRADELQRRRANFFFRRRRREVEQRFDVSAHGRQPIRSPPWLRTRASSAGPLAESRLPSAPAPAGARAPRVSARSPRRASDRRDRTATTPGSRLSYRRHAAAP